MVSICKFGFVKCIWSLCVYSHLLALSLSFLLPWIEFMLKYEPSEWKAGSNFCFATLPLFPLIKSFCPRWIDRNSWKVCHCLNGPTSHFGYAAEREHTFCLVNKMTVSYTLEWCRNWLDSSAIQSFPSFWRKTVGFFHPAFFLWVYCYMHSLLSGWKVSSKAPNGNFVCCSFTTVKFCWQRFS